MIKSKVLEKILKDKQFKSNDALLQAYTAEIQKRNRVLKPKNKAGNNYIGIEIECFTRLSRPEIMEKVLENDLEKNVHLADDGSINAGFGRSLEMRVLLKEKTVKEELEKLAKVMKRGFGVNNSCGLHIHLDMRNRDVDKCYQRLLKFQDILFGMVKSQRWNSGFCNYTVEGESLNSRYVAINRSSYKRHKTIEIRLHHATLNMKLVGKWINLLLKIINSQSTPPTIESKADVVNWAKEDKDLSSYITNKFNVKWLSKRKRLVADRMRRRHYENDYEYYLRMRQYNQVVGT